METIGFPTFRYKLLAFSIAGMICGMAGVLLANTTDFVSPNYMHWTRSGEILFMVILGGMGTLLGPVIGATAFLLMEEVLSSYTEHWQFILGPILILIVLFARRGIYGLLDPPAVDPSRRLGEVRYAGPVVRLGAFAIDLAVLFALGATIHFGASLVLGVAGGGAPPSALMGPVVYGLVPAAYFIALPASRWQATVGKRVLGIYVVARDGGRLSPRHAFQRAVAHALSSLFLTLGHLVLAFNPEREALHDRLCQTRVIHGKAGAEHG